MSSNPEFTHPQTDFIEYVTYEQKLEAVLSNISVILELHSLGNEMSKANAAYWSLRAKTVLNKE